MAMASLQLTDSNPVLLKPSLFSFSYISRRRHRLALPRASLSFPPPSSPSFKTRRSFIAETTSAPLLLAPLFGLQPPPARSDESAVSEWERVYLPIDPGVVLLDIAFVPDDLSRGLCLPLCFPKSSFPWIFRKFLVFLKPC